MTGKRKQTYVSRVQGRRRVGELSVLRLNPLPVDSEQESCIDFGDTCRELPVVARSHESSIDPRKNLVVGYHSRHIPHGRKFIYTSADIAVQAGWRAMTRSLRVNLHSRWRPSSAALLCYAKELNPHAPWIQL
ncbi:hypothetical protein FE257_003497 [Aspergillus nanangensis]|uniref:Uncharacterized protein n=1 Tax=Aspergillus nanangensis TaxID=2582783 RepID=A0AAD4CBI1_ASPNN|nr:hypothetical protein FE257_003497 [Aspergillus nanangensis]